VAPGRGDRESPPPSQPRGARHQVTTSEEDRERIERRLERMPLERDALVLAYVNSGRSSTLTNGRLRIRRSQPRGTTG
jgi:hypothetical protein